MFRLIRATKRARARSEPTTDENEIRNAKRGKKKRTRTSRNAREEVAGKGERDRIITRIKEMGRESKR